MHFNLSDARPDIKVKGLRRFNLEFGGTESLTCVFESNPDEWD